MPGHDGAPQARVAVVVPAYRVADRVAGVVSEIPPVVTAIYVVDDACPDATGGAGREAVHDPRVRVLYHATNQGVGGATVTGSVRLSPTARTSS